MTRSIQPQPAPIPVALRRELFDPMIPWAISTRLFSEMQTLGPKVPFKKVRVLPTDSEWQFILSYFLHDKPTKYDLGGIYCIHERHQTQAFESNLSSIEREANEFQPNWQTEPRAKQRTLAIQRWQMATNAFSPFQTIESDGRRRTWNKTKVLPLWHGSNSQVCNSIFKSGFVYFGKTSLAGKKPGDPKNTDDGYFGSGIYFTNSSRYAADIYSGGHLVLAWVSMREPFPVVGDPQQLDMHALRGKGAYKHYNAHYVPVVPVQPTNDCPIYHPCKEGEQPFCDEVVVFHKSQALPRFWVELEVSLPHLMTPSEIPDFVEDLVPHILKILQDSAVNKDKKLRNTLGSELAILLKMKGDDDLSPAHQTLYRQLTRVLDQSGKVDKSVRNILTQGKTKESDESPSEAGPSDRTTIADSVEKPKSISLTGPYKVETTLVGHQKAVRALLESDGILFSGDRGRELKMWDLSNGTCLKTIGIHQREIVSIYKDTDGNILTGSAAGIVRILNPKTGDCIGQFKHSDGYVNSITQNSKGDYLTGDGAQIKMWDKATKKLIKFFPGVGGFVELSPSEIAFTTGNMSKKGEEPRIIVCDQTGKQLRALRGHQHIIYCLIKLWDGKLATSSADGSVRIWDPTSGQCIQVFQGKGRMNCLIEISDDLIAATGQFPNISIWSRSTGQIVEDTGWGHANSILSLIRLDNGDLISGSNDKTIKIWRRAAV